MCALYEFTINKICCIKSGGGERGGTLGTRRGENVTANVAMTVNMINMKPLVEERVWFRESLVKRSFIVLPNRSSKRK